MNAPNRATDGLSIRSERLQRGWSQQRLIQEIRTAAHVLGENEPGVTKAMISKWENGNRSPSAQYQRLLHVVFTRNVETDDDDEWTDELNRRAFLADSAAVASLALAGSLGTEPWQRLTSALNSQTRVDRQTLDNLAVMNTHFAELFQPVAPDLLIGPVRNHLDTITNLLTRASLHPTARQHLASLAAEMSILMGWLSKEARDPWVAQQFFIAAIDASTEAENNDLGTYAIASASTLPAFRSSPTQSLSLLTQPRVKGIEMAKASTATRIWIAVLKAEVQTRTHQQQPALQAIDEADHLLTQLDPDDSRRPVLGHFDTATLAGERGITVIRLAESTDQDTQQLIEIVDELQDYPKTQTRLLTAAADAQLQKHDPDQALELALRSIGIADQTGSGVAIEDAHELLHKAHTFGLDRFVEVLSSRLNTDHQF